MSKYKINKEMYCNCQSASFVTMHTTAVDGEGRCKHCGYYATASKGFVGKKDLRGRAKYLAKQSKKNEI